MGVQETMEGGTQSPPINGKKDRDINISRDTILGNCGSVLDAVRTPGQYKGQEAIARFSET
jgi:hypothetical protein